MRVRVRELTVRDLRLGLRRVTAGADLRLDSTVTFVSHDMSDAVTCLKLVCIHDPGKIQQSVQS